MKVGECGTALVRGKEKRRDDCLGKGTPVFVIGGGGLEFRRTGYVCKGRDRIIASHVDERGREGVRKQGKRRRCEKRAKSRLHLGDRRSQKLLK